MSTAIESVLARHSNAGRDALIPVLQEVQDAQGYLSRDAVAKISRGLNLPASKVYGVATFYNQFRFEALGQHHIQVCRGTACHVKGSAAVLEAIERHLDIKAGNTSRDGTFSLEVVACIGACGLAPVISVDGKFYANVQPDDVASILDSYREEKHDDAD